jgi:hypothetical protein
MYRIFKPMGSIFLHYDWHANAYIQVVTVEKIIPVATKPVIGVHINELEKDN